MHELHGNYKSKTYNRFTKAKKKETQAYNKKKIHQIMKWKTTKKKWLQQNKGTTKTTGKQEWKYH